MKKNMRKRNKTIRGSSKTIPVAVKKGSADVLSRLVFLDKKQPHAVLATVSDNEPHTSLIAYAITSDMKGLVFATPRETRKYRNIIKNKHVCLLIDTRSNTAQDYVKAESMSVVGSAHVMRKGPRKEKLIKIFLKKHPRLKNFVHADSTALILVRVVKCIHVSSFQVVSEFTW